jgi:REP element-mobilizing transposase RayT
MQKQHGKDLRKGRHSQTGNIYLITTVTDQRQPVFYDLHNVRTAINALFFNDKQGKVTTLAYVLMPDHLHWLFQLHSGSLGELMRDFKGYSSKQINRLRNDKGKIWQAAYHDHALREEEDVRSVARYIIANPLRAGLVDSVGDYPHWDAVWLEGGDAWD